MRTVRDAGFSCLSLTVAAWENIRFSSLFAAGDVSRGGTRFLQVHCTLLNFHVTAHDPMVLRLAPFNRRRKSVIVSMEDR